MQEAMQAIRDVHKSDELMWLELVPPYAPLDEVCSLLKTFPVIPLSGTSSVESHCT